MKPGKSERGIITGYVTGKKAVAEFYAKPGSSKDKGKIEMLGWGYKKHDSMTVNLLEPPIRPSLFPQTFILKREIKRPIRGCVIKSYTK